MHVHLFDLDGTLSDSGDAILRALNSALWVEGIEPLPHAMLPRLIGPPLAHSLGEILGLDEERLDDLIERYRRIYSDLSLVLARTYPGVPEMVHRTADRNRVGVVTSKPYRFAAPIVEQLGFGSLMSIVEGPRSSEIEPKSVTLRRAIDALGIDAGEVTMVGDRRHDIEAAQDVGAASVGVTWGYGSRSELQSAGADRIIDHPSDLLSSDR